MTEPPRYPSWEIFNRSPDDSKVQPSLGSTVLTLSTQSVVHAIGITGELIRNADNRALIFVKCFFFAGCLGGSVG